MRDSRFVTAAIILAITSFFLSCSDDKASRPVAGIDVRSLNAVKGPNVRKSGNISLISEDLTSAKRSIVALTDEYHGQILSEQADVGPDDRLTLRYQIKVPAQSFSVLLDKLALTGKLLNLSIEAEDVSDELSIQSDRVDLLTARLNDALKANNATLADEIKGKLQEAKSAKQDLRSRVLYSYIRLTLTESTKLGQALALGIYYGREGFVLVAKVTLITVISSVPVVLIYLIGRIILALLRHPWRKLLNAIEKLAAKRN